MDTKTARLVRTLRLRHLELLVALSETATMRGAAARLHLSQPAISKMLGEVESCFGARLFERSHQGIHANALGVSAAFRARAVLNELARATEDVDALQSGVTAVLRVGAPSVTAAVPAAIVRLRERMPGVAVQLREGRVQELIHRLLQGELDCVFGAITPELLSSDMVPLLEPAVLLKDALCVLASASNGSIAARSYQWAELQAAKVGAAAQGDAGPTGFHDGLSQQRRDAARAGDRGHVVGDDRHGASPGCLAAVRGTAGACGGRDRQGRSAKARCLALDRPSIVRPFLPAGWDGEAVGPDGVRRRHTPREPGRRAEETGGKTPARGQFSGNCLIRPSRNFCSSSTAAAKSRVEPNTGSAHIGITALRTRACSAELVLDL